MKFNYTALAAQTVAILTTYGQPLTRRSYTLGVYDPATGAAATTTTDTKRTGVLLDFGVGVTLERGNLVQATDKRLLLEATAVVEPQDHFIVGGIVYTIVSVGEVNPAGTRVLYDLHVRS